MKPFFTLFLNIYSARQKIGPWKIGPWKIFPYPSPNPGEGGIYWLFHSYYTSIQCKKYGSDDKQEAAINSRFVGLKKGVPWNKSITGAMSAFQTLQLLESDSIAGIVLLCCSVNHFGLRIYCGGKNFWFITQFHRKKTL